MEVDAIHLLEDLGYTLTKKGFYRDAVTNKELSVKQGNFYQTDNPMFAGCIAKTDEGEVSLLPFAKKEIEKLYKELCIKSGNNKKLATYNLLMELRIPWSEKLWGAAEESKTESWRFVISKQNSLPQYKGNTMADSEPYSGEDTSIEEHTEDSFKLGKNKRNQYKKFWGKSYNDEELEYLQSAYDDYVRIYPDDTPAQINGYKHIAKTYLLAERALEEGNTKTYKDMMDTSSKLHNDLNIKPMQESGVNDNSKDSFGQFVEMIEQTEPIPEPLDVFKDVDGIIKYIQKWFVGHFEKIFGIANSSNEILDDALEDIEGDLNE